MPDIIVSVCTDTPFFHDKNTDYDQFIDYPHMCRKSMSLRWNKTEKFKQQA